MDIFFHKYYQIDIDIEDRVIKNKTVSCYIPKINGVEVLGDNGYILRESESNGVKTDNKELAMKFIKYKLDEIDFFMQKNSKFL